MTRINLDFSVSDAKKITKITMQKQKTHTYTTAYTHTHTYTTAQHNSMSHINNSTAHHSTQYSNPGSAVHQRYARWAQRGGPETERTF